MIYLMWIFIFAFCSSDDRWLVLSEVSGGSFETLKEFYVEPNSTFDIPIHFKPKTLGKHEVFSSHILISFFY